MKKMLIFLLIVVSFIFFILSFFLFCKEENIYSRFDQKNIDKIVLDSLSKIRRFEGKKATSIAVLNYHFFYDPSLGEKCNETICLKISKLEEHIII